MGDGHSCPPAVEFDLLFLLFVKPTPRPTPPALLPYFANTSSPGATLVVVVVVLVGMPPVSCMTNCKMVLVD